MRTSTINKKLRLLIVEDSEDDALLLLHQLKNGGYNIDYKRIETAVQMRDALTEKKWDIVLSDYSLPHFGGLEALSILKESGIDIPFIIISGAIGEEIAVKAMKRGAHDYLMKGNFNRLLPAIERELRESDSRAEKRKAEFQLIESEHKFRSLAESSPDNIIRYDTKCRALYINRNMSLTVGSEVVSIIGLTPTESNKFPGTVDYQAKLEQVIKTGQPDEIEMVVPDRNGQLRVHHIRFVAERNNDSEIIGAMAIGRDITDRKNAEMEIAHMNRSLRMLSDVNHALLHITDETTLLNEVCRIAVDIGGYCSAWVGFAEHNEEKTLRPVAHAGSGAEYIMPAQVSWEDNEHGQQPAGIAIRSGQPCIVRNIPFDPTFAPWCESASQHEYNSIIALPLISDGQKYGAISIYSPKADAFDDKEVEILLELTNELAFGISAIHTRIEYDRAEYENFKSEKRFKELTNLLPQTIYEADENGIIIFANEAALTTFGYSVNDISLGIHMLNMVSEKDKAEAWGNVKRIMEGLQPTKNEYQMVRKDGTTFPALTFTAPIIHNQKTVGIRGSIANITERKKAENELRKLSEAVKQSPASIIITDINGNIEYVNKTFEDNTGYSAQEVYLKNPRILRSEHTNENEYKVLWETIMAGQTWHGEFLNTKKNGEYYWENAYISPIKNDEGLTTHFLAVKQDITEKKKTEQELIEAKKRAEESDRLKTAFLQNISHEIRTPMNGLLGFVKLLTSSNVSSEKQAMYLNVIDQSGRRLLNIINDIFEISKIETGQMPLRIQETNVNQLMKDLNMFFVTEVKSKNMKMNIYCGLSDEECTIKTDQTKLFQILTNLIKNALKFTNEGSIDFGYTKKNELFEFFVRDTGIGIDPSQKEVIFERFRQGNVSLSRSYEGAGLGLSISKSFIELLGGKIWVESEVEKGSTFFFTIPNKF